MAATLTGSTPAGASVAAIAGSEIKKVVLELGGSDPFVVMPSADLPRAAEVAAFARLLNNGQSCIAAKRFIVHDAVYDEFERLFTAQMAAKTVGDPMLDGTDIGPLASEQQRDDVEHLVADAVAKGARALCGGAAPEGSGFYYPPTVLTELPSVSLLIAAYNEEAVIEKRLQTALMTDYPRNKLEVVVASDGSSDATSQIVRRYAGRGVRLLDYARRRGKAAVLNATVAELRGEIVLLSDANTQIDPSALRRMVGQDPGDQGAHDQRRRQIRDDDERGVRSEIHVRHLFTPLARRAPATATSRARAAAGSRCASPQDAA